jgi:ABC-type branched-subunit amino acid transport system ATPase component
MDVALQVTERVTVLHSGRVVADGPTETVRWDPRVREICLGTSDA